MRDRKVILIVDDEPFLTEILQEIIEGHGYATLTADGGAVALGILQTSQHVDLVLTDLVMPGPVSGMMLVGSAAELRPGIPVIVTSGYPETSSPGANPGYLHWILKPYDFKELSRILDNILRPDMAATT